MYISVSPGLNFAIITWEEVVLAGDDEERMHLLSTVMPSVCLAFLPPYKKERSRGRVSVHAYQPKKKPITMRRGQLNSMPIKL